VQRTGGDSTSSGGDREFIPTIARMAAAGRYLPCPSSPTNQLTKNLLVGVDGLFIETHPEPARGLSDATTMLPLHELQPLLEELMDIALASKAKQGR
ncbi:hypothetical protein DYB34_011649, partial [Aphanomyces astaci]